jgi:hypothetical protein
MICETVHRSDADDVRKGEIMRELQHRRNGYIEERASELYEANVARFASCGYDIVALERVADEAIDRLRKGPYTRDAIRCRVEGLLRDRHSIPGALRAFPDDGALFR